MSTAPDRLFTQAVEKIMARIDPYISGRPARDAVRAYLYRDAQPLLVEAIFAQLKEAVPLGQHGDNCRVCGAPIQKKDSDGS